jgi:hypothetical protein
MISEEGMRLQIRDMKTERQWVGEGNWQEECKTVHIGRVQSIFGVFNLLEMKLLLGHKFAE